MNPLLHALPYALINTASPTIPVVAVALLALPGKGRRNLVAYLVGCALVVAVMTVLVAVVFANSSFLRTLSRGVPNWADGLLGVALVVIGGWLWRRGPQAQANNSRSWDHVGPIAALGVGAYMELINLVTPPAYLTGVAIVTSGDGTMLARTIDVFVLAMLVLAPVVLLLVIAILAPARTDAFIARLQAFGHRYGHQAVIVLLLGGGMFLLLRWAWNVWIA